MWLLADLPAILPPQSCARRGLRHVWLLADLPAIPPPQSCARRRLRHVWLLADLPAIPPPQSCARRRLRHVWLLADLPAILPPQSCARRRLRHVWLLPLLADLLVRSFSAGCRPHLLRCRRRDWLRHLRRWGADPAGADPPRALFQRQATAPPKYPARAETATETERKAERKIEETAGAEKETEVTATEAQRPVDPAEGCDSGSGESGRLVVEAEVRSSAVDEGVVSAVDGGDAGAAGGPVADAGGSSREGRPTSEEQNGEECATQADSAPGVAPQPSTADGGGDQLDNVVPQPEVALPESTLNRSQPTAGPSTLASPESCARSEDDADRAEPALLAGEASLESAAAALAGREPCRSAVPGVEDGEADLEAGVSSGVSSSAETASVEEEEPTREAVTGTIEPTPGRDSKPEPVPAPAAAVASAPDRDADLDSLSEPESVLEFGRGLRHAAGRLVVAVRQSEAVAAQLRTLNLPAKLLDGMPELFCTAVPAVEGEDLEGGEISGWINGSDDKSMK